jgi:hypothetical protein
MILALQNGHIVGRATSPATRNSDMMFIPFPDVSNRLGLTEQDDIRRPEPKSLTMAAAAATARFLTLLIVFCALGYPSRPTLIEGACVSRLGYRHLGVHEPHAAGFLTLLLYKREQLADSTLRPARSERSGRGGCAHPAPFRDGRAGGLKVNRALLSVVLHD